MSAIKGYTLPPNSRFVVQMDWENVATIHASEDAAITYVRKTWDGDPLPEDDHEMLDFIADDVLVWTDAVMVPE